MKYIAQIIIEQPIEARSEEEAARQASDWQKSIAGSNDGSEILANGVLAVIPCY